MSNCTFTTTTVARGSALSAGLWNDLEGINIEATESAAERLINSEAPECGQVILGTSELVCCLRHRDAVSEWIDGYEVAGSGSSLADQIAERTGAEYLVWAGLVEAEVDSPRARG